MTRHIIFGETKIPVPTTITTIEQARGFAATIIPDLGDAQGTVEGGDFVFKKRAGSKGL